MALTGVARRLSAGERAREPKTLGLVAYMDGYGQATGLRPMTYPRRLTPDEAADWRQGWREGRAEVCVCHPRWVVCPEGRKGMPPPPVGPPLPPGCPR